MNKERLEWIISGLNQYKLTKNEGQFVKTALEDFDQKHTLTEHQEEKIETLYKEKSKLKPVKDYFAFKESSPKKPRVRRPPKVMF